MKMVKPNFEQEYCRCGRLGEFVEMNNYYRWRCRNCGVSWVTERSPMDVANEIVYHNDPSVIVVENDSETKY